MLMTTGPTDEEEQVNKEGRGETWIGDNMLLHGGTPFRDNAANCSFSHSSLFLSLFGNTRYMYKTRISIRLPDSLAASIDSYIYFITIADILFTESC